MRRIAVIVAVASIIGSFTVVLSLSTGPPDGRTGAPGESNCTIGCHSSFVLNSGNGSLAIQAPATFTTGETIALNVHLEDPGQSRWGFELTVLDAANLPVGELQVVDVVRTQKTLALTGREYVKHTLAGTDQVGANPQADWQLSWTASGDISGSVTFYASGNAANNSGTNLGDYIYTTSLTINPDLTGCCLGRVGDANGSGDDEPTIGDISVMIDALFIGGDPSVIGCLAEADINQSGGVTPIASDITIGDISYLIDYLFITGSSLGLPDCL